MRVDICEIRDLVVTRRLSSRWISTRKMGVEFDSDDDEGREIAKRQVREELTEELQKLGFSSQEIADALDHSDIEEN